MIFVNVVPSFPEKMAVPPELFAALDALEAQLASLETAIDPLLSTDFENDIPSLAPVDRAQFNFLLAYALNTLLYTYSRISGSTPDELEQVKSELERVRGYYSKLQNVKKASKK